MPVSPIGGMLLSSFGAVLGFRPFQGSLPSPGQPPPTNGQTLLDVQRWELRKKYAQDDVTGTGHWGADGNSLTCVGFALNALLLIDLQNPPDFLTESGQNAPPSDMDQGFQLWLYRSALQNFPKDIPQQYHFAPSCKGNLFSVVADCVARKRVRAQVEIVGNSPIFLLNLLGTGLEMQAYNGYIAHCQTRNWKW